MLLTSGDLFFAVLGPALAVTFTGAGLAVANSRAVRRLGAVVFFAGIAGLLSPMFGSSVVLTHFIHIN